MIAGARAAGSAVAMLLARAGARVLLVERGRLGDDTLSTHALMRGAVLQLQRWNLLPPLVAAGTPAVQQATFHYGDDALVVPVKPRDGIDALYAPRRTVLDPLLARAAVEAGAVVRWQARITSLVRDEQDRVSGVVLTDADAGTETVGAELVVGADGMRSTVARLAGARTYRVGRHASGVVYGYWSELEVDGYHWHQCPGAAAGAIPTNDGETLVFASVASRDFQRTFGDPDGYRRVLALVAPDLSSRLDAATQRRRFSGFSGQRGFFRQSWGPGWALVGDAAWFKDPITAHGITDALRDAELLSGSVLRGDERAFASYQAERDELSVPLFDISDAIASFEWDLPAVRRLHESLAREMGREVKAMTARQATAAGV